MLAVLSLFHLLSSAVAGETRVALVDFDANTEPALAPLGLGLADMMVTDLSRADGLVLVERERLQDVLDELAFQQSTLVDPNTAAQLGKAVGAEVVVTGAITVHDDTMRMDARAIDVETGTVRFATEVEGKDDQFFKLEGKLARKLADGLGGTFPNRFAIRLEQPRAQSTDAAVTYGTAVQALDEGDVATAESRAFAAAKADTGFKNAERLALRAREKGVAGFGLSVTNPGGITLLRLPSVVGTAHLWAPAGIGLFVGGGTPSVASAADGGTRASWVHVPVHAGARFKLLEDVVAGTYQHYALRGFVALDPTSTTNAADGRPDGFALNPGAFVGTDVEVATPTAPFALNIQVAVGYQDLQFQPGVTSNLSIRMELGLLWYFARSREVR
jgi:TolB-like protein